MHSTSIYSVIVRCFYTFTIYFCCDLTYSDLMWLIFKICEWHIHTSRMLTHIHRH